MVDGARLLQGARAHAGQNLDSLVDSVDWVNVEAAVGYRFDRLRVEHQVDDIGARQQYSLRAAKAGRFADAVEAFVLLLCAANPLNRAVLLYRPPPSPPHP